MTIPKYQLVNVHGAVKMDIQNIRIFSDKMYVVKEHTVESLIEVNLRKSRQPEWISVCSEIRVVYLVVVLAGYGDVLLRMVQERL